MTFAYHIDHLTEAYLAGESAESQDIGHLIEEAIKVGADGAIVEKGVIIDE